ncbi:adenosylmethionine decarboxylase [Butyrivibrio fibrisolvens]|uniref:adenosylmethionine decarboxylase n=1 Tax=Butyrivibrio fibrisolvens TaxID=831 RepID=UPI0003B57221|nr:adenosylmethionine decarboxylase [Butyrivibrio fibrisolvens]
MARHLVADLYGCTDMIDDPEAIKEAAHKAIDFVGAEIVEECIHEFEPIGVTYFAVITTSHFSVHTWPEYGYAAIDVFSCSDTVTEGITDKLKELFKATQIKTQIIERNISSF